MLVPNTMIFAVGILAVSPQNSDQFIFESKLASVPDIEGIPSRCSPRFHVHKAIDLFCQVTVTLTLDHQVSEMDGRTD